MNVLILVLLGSSSFALALILTPLFRRLAIRFGVVDQPDFRRKIHDRPIPRIGGVPISLAYIGSYLILMAVFHRTGLGDGGSLPTAWSILPAALLVFLIGLADDIFGLKPWQKLAGQALASVLAVSAGVRITALAGFTLNPWIASLATILWLIGCANALNLIDGVDGLASGIALLAAATTAAAALLNGEIGLAFATIPLAGALLGFLRYNFNPASIFLGDCGSLTIGFLLGCYSVQWSAKSATMLGMTAPLIALAIPLLDTALAIVRRFLRQQPIFVADRSHIHHCLLARGFTVRRVAVLLYGAAGCAGVLSLLMTQYHRQWGGAIIVLAVLGAVVGIQQLGYAEFGTARRLMLSDTFRRLLNTQISLDVYERRLGAAATPDECWSVIESAARDFGFSRAEMLFAGCEFEFEERAQPMSSWEVRVPISEFDFLILTHSFGGACQTNLIAPLVEMLRRTLAPKLPVFSHMTPESYRPHELAAAASSGDH